MPALLGLRSIDFRRDRSCRRVSLRGRCPVRQASGRSGVARPGGEQTAVVRDEVLLLVRRKRRLNGANEDVVEVARREPLVGELVQVRESRRTELLVLVHLEVGVGELAVLRELLLVAEVVSVAPDEVVPRVL